MKSRKDVVIIHSNRIGYSTSFEEIPLSAVQLVPLPPKAPDFLWRHNSCSKKRRRKSGKFSLQVAEFEG